MLKDGAEANGFYIRDNKSNVEWLLWKQSLNAFKSIQHRFNLDSTCFNAVEGGGGGKQTVSRSLFNI